MRYTTMVATVKKKSYDVLDHRKSEVSFSYLISYLIEKRWVIAFI